MTTEPQPRKENAATQQIAREAAMKILPQDSYDTLTKIIFSAIERAKQSDVDLAVRQAEEASARLDPDDPAQPPRKAPSERSEQWKQSVEDQLDRIERRLRNVPHY